MPCVRIIEREPVGEYDRDARRAVLRDRAHRDEFRLVLADAENVAVLSCLPGVPCGTTREAIARTTRLPLERVTRILGRLSGPSFGVKLSPHIVWQATFWEYDAADLAFDRLTRDSV